MVLQPGLFFFFRKIFFSVLFNLTLLSLPQVLKKKKTTLLVIMKLWSNFYIDNSCFYLFIYLFFSCLKLFEFSNLFSAILWCQIQNRKKSVCFKRTSKIIKNLIHLVGKFRQIVLAERDIQQYHGTNAHEKYQTRAAEQQHESSFLGEAFGVGFAASHSASSLARASVNHHYAKIQPSHENRWTNFEHHFQQHLVHLGREKNISVQKKKVTIFSKARIMLWKVWLWPMRREKTFWIKCTYFLPPFFYLSRPLCSKSLLPRPFATQNHNSRRKHARKSILKKLHIFFPQNLSPPLLSNTLLIAVKCVNGRCIIEQSD